MMKTLAKTVALVLCCGAVDSPTMATTIASVSLGTPFSYNAQYNSFTATMTNNSVSFTITEALNGAMPAAGMPISSTTSGFRAGTVITGTCSGSIPSITCTASTIWTGKTGPVTLSTYYNGGDTYFSSWCSTPSTGAIDGGVSNDIYTWTNDENYLNGPVSANMPLNLLSNTTIGAVNSGGMEITTDNTNVTHWGTLGEIDTTGKPPYGGGANASPQTRPDYANWKTAGLLCIHDASGSGKDYLFGIAMRTIYEAQGGQILANMVSAGIYPWGQPAFNAQMISESETAGAGTGRWSGFAPTPPSKAFHFTSPEWPSVNGAINPAQAFDAGLIQYGQGYTCQYAGFTGCTTLPDGAATYVYGVFPREGYAYGSSTMGIGRAAVAKLIAHVANPRASDWQYFIGGDGTQSSNWVSGISNAVAIMSDPHHLGLGQPVYLPNANGVRGTGLYIMPVSYYVSNYPSAQPLDNDTAKTVTAFWQAPHPWGPWSKFQSIMNNPEGIYFPVIQAGSISANSTTFNILNAQNYLSGSPRGGQYHLYETFTTVIYQ